MEKLPTSWEYKLWSDVENRNFIKKFYPWFLQKYDFYDVNIKRADVMRFFYVYHYGGAYFDMDYECIRSFEHFMTHNLTVSLMDRYKSGEIYIPNSMMIATPCHPFMREVLYCL